VFLWHLIETVDPIKLVFGTEFSPHCALIVPLVHCVIKKEGFFTNSVLRRFRNGTSIIAKCCQFSSTEVDAQCDNLATVVARRSN